MTTPPSPPLRTARLSLRVHPATKERLNVLLGDLAARGLHTNETELVETFVSQALTISTEDVEAAIRHHRATT